MKKSQQSKNTPSISIGGNVNNKKGNTNIGNIADDQANFGYLKKKSLSQATENYYNTKLLEKETEEALVKTESKEFYQPREGLSSPSKNQSLILSTQIGQGGFGQVYLGRYQGQEVAVKKLNISFNTLSEDSLIAVKRELDLLKKLDHSNIIKFIASEQAGNDLLIIMEYANGGSLTDYINRNQGQEHDWNLNYQLMFNMTQGLNYLHQQKIVHRDLKSMNILLSNNTAKLADFGLSRVKTLNTRTNPTNQVGTLRWMAPEILIHNKSHTFASDIYSLGMIFWELVTKCTIPFKNDEERFIANNYCRGEREEIPTDTPTVLKEIINDCWKEESTERISLAKIENKLNRLEENKELVKIQDRAIIIQNSQAVPNQSNNLTEINIKELEEQIITKEKELEQLISSIKDKLKSRFFDSRTKERHELLNQLLINGFIDSSLNKIAKEKKINLQTITNLQATIKNLQEQLNELNLEQLKNQIQIPSKN